MKNSFTSFLFCFIIFHGLHLISAQENKRPEGRPKTIEQSFLYFNQLFDEVALYNFKTLPEDVATSRLHHGFGTWIRNNWGLWGNSPLKRNLKKLGVFHPDDMSSLLLKSYHRFLNNTSLNLPKEIKNYKDKWDLSTGTGFSAADLGIDHSRRASSKEYLSYFPVGDTVIVSIYAVKKTLFSTKSDGLEGYAVVEKHLEKNLMIRLISRENRKGYIGNQKVGDTYEIPPAYCNMLPPNYKIEKF